MPSQCWCGAYLSPNQRVDGDACLYHCLDRSQRVLRTFTNPGQAGIVTLKSFPKRLRDSQPELFATFEDKDCAAEIRCLSKRTDIDSLRHVSTSGGRQQRTRTDRSHHTTQKQNLFCDPPIHPTIDSSSVGWVGGRGSSL